MERKKIKIREVASVIMGQPFSKEAYGDEGVPVIGVKEIVSGSAPSRFIRSDYPINSDRMARDGDLLISIVKRDQVFIYHFVSEKNLPAVVGGGLMIIRPRKDKLMEFSAVFGSDNDVIAFSRKLENLYKGRVIKTLSVKEVKEVEVEIDSHRKLASRFFVQPTEFVIQNSNNEGISYSEIVKRINYIFDGKINTLRVYVKSEEGKAYYVVDDCKMGSIDLFDF